ncbi:MAG: ABC transporter permease [Alphaproteobacteria bacterium]|nr:ABC transporter permease [Alphaproteobacteria bacterium]
MNSLKKKRRSAFCKNKKALISLYLFLLIFLVSLCAPFIANDKPILLWDKKKIYFPQSEFVSDQMLGGNLPTAADFSDPFTITYLEENNFFVIKPLIKYSYDTVDYFSLVPFPSKPDSSHLLGTDDQGRDVFARLLYALRISILFGLSLTFLSAVMGVFVGAIQGYFGGKVDLIIGRFLEIWSSLPQLFILIIVSSLIAPSFLSLLLILLLFSWTQLTGVVRAEFLKTRGLDYIKSAKTLGVSDFVIMWRHILPNALVATITYIPFMLSAAIVSLSALDFLGFGLPVGTPGLGELIRQGKENLAAPWLGLTAFFVMTILLALLVFIGEGVRDAFDPHQENKNA